MSIWMALAYALLPFVGNFAGGLVAEKVRASDRAVSLALHWAAGMILGVVGIEIMPRVMKAKPIWPVLISILLGGILAILAHKAIEVIQKRRQSQKNSNQEGSTKGPWAIFFAVFIDLLSDGLAIGTSATISSNFTLLVVFGLVIGDFPEGFVNVVMFKHEKASKKFRYGISSLLILPPVLGAALAYWLVNGRPEFIKMTVLAFTAGMLLRAAVEDMVSKAHSKSGESAWTELTFIAGFVAYATGSAYLSEGG
ncbi:MAG: ZIP family metal transporter [Oligoflexus sp.]